MLTFFYGWGGLIYTIINARGPSKDSIYLFVFYSIVLIFLLKYNKITNNTQLIALENVRIVAKKQKFQKGCTQAVYHSDITDITHSTKAID